MRGGAWPFYYIGAYIYMYVYSVPEIMNELLQGRTQREPGFARSLRVEYCYGRMAYVMLNLLLEQYPIDDRPFEWFNHGISFRSVVTPMSD